ncbi:MAG: AMP-binding protein [Pikeienuella sp.]|uniref:AMP-binding protein n=1 Tax=Pikeienuella sp. TaxID=2831957 RepID=UPI00391C5FDE
MAAADPSCGGLLPLLPEREGARALGDDTGLRLTRGELREAALSLAARMEPGEGKRLVLLLAPNGAGAVIGLLGALAAGHAVALADPGLDPAKLARLEGAYRPDFALSPSPEGEAAPGMALARREGGAPIRGAASVLLSTSGTTGSAKFVRLAAEALAANARQIGAALSIEESDVGVGHLAPHYSYGLSVVTSHLVAGAAVWMTSGSLVSPEFWPAVAAAGGTHFPGVPFHYTVLARFGLAAVPPSVRTFTQAGGALDRRFLAKVADEVSARGGRFFVMYGQTEAAPRMTTLPAERLAEKPGSVGPALPGGRLSILDEAGADLPPGEAGAVAYEGPNVMLGYAETRADLDRGDEQGGRLLTGDLGFLDEEGYLHLTGRSQRFAKVAGLRLSLDEIERQLEPPCLVAALEKGESVIVFHEEGFEEPLKAQAKRLAAEYGVPAASFRLRALPALPLKPSGKVDYARLKAEADV